MTKKSRKEQAKIDYLKKNAWLDRVLARRNISADQLSDTVLPDDFEFDGYKVVGGKFCKTAGEYKAALKREYGDY